jgi:RimJ/RimL family protein N-acetyltransferase
MEEIEFIPECQGQNNLFKQLYGFVLSILPENIVYVEAYSHKNNTKSQRILQHLGLEIIGENKSGKSYHFKGLYDDLKKWYYRK